MEHTLIYSAASGVACEHALRVLHKHGIPATDHPTPDITHLLLDVPSFSSDGLLLSGVNPEHILERIPTDVTVIGGNLRHSALSGYRNMDLLQDEIYLSRNAAITADCAIKVAAPLLKTVFSDTPTLVIGWGRIGKCLSQLLKSLSVPVTVSARNPKDRATLTALGYPAVDTKFIPHGFRLIFNTVPAPIPLPPMPDCVKIDLASTQGLPSEDVICARGLPGKMAPESSGQLIAETILRLCKEESS